ncbi:MAG: hypothetical protein EOM67_11505 [Spirochaetia bacterium]|nr:hypothetical protein [Spirochaetia bacterium]
MKKVYLFLLILFVIFLSTSCLATDNILQQREPAGFLLGIWHGWTAPLALILGFFVDDIRIYSPNNTGWWYDAGFYMAIISGFGGLSLVRKNKDK